ncbi:MAG: uroporphyrinogen decarboxylase family protein [Spirochaetales bacterium]|nr:uroporphyrinogen decarboxylase family protein [Spirochaetales bacterium]MCF7937416.1 uroporphyrinogen decarboxylase family protein [Spirochaetales bacterium]
MASDNPFFTDEGMFISKSLRSKHKQGSTDIIPERTEKAKQKLERVNKALRHEEPDRVPVSDFFWGQFLQRWREDLGLPEGTDIYEYYDLDFIVTLPNMDPHIKDFEILKQTDDEVLVKTGYEAHVRKKFTYPMPAFVHFDTNTIEKMEAFEFDDPFDDRRYYSGGDNQIGGVGDGFARDLPPWVDQVKALYPDIPVYGSVCEAQEQGWRIIGSENMLLWIGLYPEKLGKFLRRVGDFLVGITEGQIKAANGMLDGMVIWGDVAYKNGMMFSPEYWRKYFKPVVADIVDVCHSNNIPVIYHGCGDSREIFSDMIDLGIDGYNPLEAKSGLDVIELRREYDHKIALCGNMDVMEWADLPMDQLKNTVLRKLNAAKGGGMIFMSDHSVPNSVSGERFDYVMKLVREYGNYPLDLGEHDIPDIK